MKREKNQTGISRRNYTKMIMKGSAGWISGLIGDALAKAKLFLIIPFCLYSFGILSAQSEKNLTSGEQPVYKVSKAIEPITVDGKMDEAGWKNAEIRIFNYFYRWDRIPIPDKQKTVFRMLWDEKNIYLFYECEDTCLTAREKIADSEPYYDDCAEFFCIPFPDSLKMHFAFELNLYKIPYDFIQLENFYNGKPTVIKSYNPNYNLGVTFEGTLNDDTDKDKGWKMELAIPFSAFNDINSFFPAKAGTRWTFQAVRQDRNVISDKSRTGSTLFPLSARGKDVHQSSHFGLLEFIE